jgi:hypothetical protein
LLISQKDIHIPLSGFLALLDLSCPPVTDRPWVHTVVLFLGIMAVVVFVPIGVFADNLVLVLHPSKTP